MPSRRYPGQHQTFVFRAAIVGCIRCATRLDVRAPPPVGELCEIYRVTFAQRNIVREHHVSDSTTYLNRETQTTLMNYNYQAGQFIGFWIARLRNTRNATEPLPDANFET